MKRRLSIILLMSVIAVTALWAALAPVTLDTREQLFEIPKGTWARRMAGEQAAILPDRITLTLGVRDILLLRNSDTVPQIFGPVLIMPGQDFRLPFAQAGEHPFDCTAHASGQMTVVVEDEPRAGWARLRWRFLSLIKHIA